MHRSPPPSETRKKNAADIYVRLALPYVARALHLLDQNPFSPTYGSFDRTYWHYRSADFPCGMSQQMALLLALVYANDCSENPYYQVARIRKLAIAASRYAIMSSHPDGSCDDYYPYEKALGGLAFSLYALTETYRILEDNHEETLSFFLKRVSILQKLNESGRLGNHQALAALAAYSSFSLTGDDCARKVAEDRLALAISWQHPEEGWFQEYEGADPGYQTCTIDFLAKYRKQVSEHEAKKLPELENALVKAVDFSWLFMHPDGSYGGEYGSRNTYHFFPHGFELLTPLTEKAAQLTNAFLLGAENGKAYRNDDDRMAPLPAISYLQAWEDRHPEEVEGLAVSRRDPKTIWLQSCGMLISWNGKECNPQGGRYLVANLFKGGVLKVYDQEGPIAADTGVIAETEDGAILISHLFQDDPKVEHRVSEEGISKWVIKGFLCKRSSNLMTPIKNLFFRLWCLSVGRIRPQWTRKLVQRIAITGKRTTSFPFERIIELHDERIDVHDRLPAELPIRRIAVGCDATSIYVASSLSYQEARLCPWQYAHWDKLPLAEDKKTWTRSYFRGSGHSPYDRQI